MVIFVTIIVILLIVGVYKDKIIRQKIYENCINYTDNYMEAAMKDFNDIYGGLKLYGGFPRHRTEKQYYRQITNTPNLIINLLEKENICLDLDELIGDLEIASPVATITDILILNICNFFEFYFLIFGFFNYQNL